MSNKLESVNISIKPVSAACNLACGYCFHTEEANRTAEGFTETMPHDTMERLIAGAMRDVGRSCGFAFLGGEPTLAGLDFYRSVVDMQKKYNTRGLSIQNSIQTNGVGLDAEWADFFRENDFQVGLSLDGTADVHNAQRRDREDKATFGAAVATLRLFKNHGVKSNVLLVVTGPGSRHISSSYRFLMKQGISRLQFIPCMEPPDSERGASEWSLAPEQYGSFLVRIFDLWYRDLMAGRYTSVRHFDNWIGILLGRRPEACGMSGRCSPRFVVEADGGVYPCEFYTREKWRMGSVDDGLEALGNSGAAKRFIARSEPVPERCRSCQWGALCLNGCRRDRWLPEGETVPVNYHCEAHRHFFQSRYNAMRRAASVLQRF